MDLTNSLGDAFGAEFRDVKDGEHHGAPARIVIGARTYATGINDLWDALTSAERLKRWFAPITGDLKEGGRYQLEGNAGGRITHCAPPDAFDLTWEFGGDTSYVSVRLTPDGDGVRLTLEHAMPKTEASEAHWEKYGPGATGVGWDLSFLGLALYADSAGGDVDQDALNAWMSADAGKAFMRASAAAWGAAHAASGETPETAQSMAHQTAAFYTGA